MNYKRTFLFAVGLSVLTACYAGDTYTVTGTADFLHDGDSVFIQKKNADSRMVTVDTAVIVNGTFRLSGTIDEPEVRYIGYRTPYGISASTTFFLEKGDIRLALSQKGLSEIKGTVTNEIWNMFVHKLDSMTAAMNPVYQQLRDENLGKAERQACADQVKQHRAGVENFMLKTLKSNIGNPVGLFLLEQHYRVLDTATADSILAMVPEQYRNYPVVVSMSKKVLAEKNSAVGQHFTDFEMQTPEGKSVKLSDFISQNEVTLVDFWASWCGPCRAEMPNVKKAYLAYKDKGLGVVGVSLDDNAEAWTRSIKELDLPWPQLSDLKGRQCIAVQLYAIQGIPFTLLIDRNGRILAKGIRGNAIEEKLKEILH